MELARLRREDSPFTPPSKFDSYQGGSQTTHTVVVGPFVSRSAATPQRQFRECRFSKIASARTR